MPNAPLPCSTALLAVSFRSEGRAAGRIILSLICSRYHSRRMTPWESTPLRLLLTSDCETHSAMSCGVPAALRIDLATLLSGLANRIGIGLYALGPYSCSDK